MGRRRRGRYPKYLGKELLLNRILSLWRERGDILTFSEIHKEFVRMGIVSKPFPIKDTAIGEKLVFATNGLKEYA